MLVQLSASSEWDVRKEATWVISNVITAAKKVHISHLVSLGVISPLCELLDVGEVKVLHIAMVRCYMQSFIFYLELTIFDLQEALECILRMTNAQNDSSITTLIDEAGGVDKVGYIYLNVYLLLLLNIFFLLC